MALNDLLLRSARLHERLETFFALPLQSNSPRLQAARIVTSLSFDHSQCMKHLVAIEGFSSAAALLRVQYETLTRALWLLYVAKESEIEILMTELTDDSAKKASSIPMLSKMLDDIERVAPHAPVAHLREFKHYSWKPLSSFVHGGIHAVNRHGAGFPVLLIEMMVRHSNGLLTIGASFLMVLAGMPPTEGRMAKIHAEFHDCLPPIDPPFKAREEPAS